MTISPDIFRLLLSTNTQRDPRSLEAFLELLETCPFESPIERALWGGFNADRLGYAFTAGYAAALSRLLERSANEAKAHSAARRTCLCVTEAGGGHPRAMTTTLKPNDDGSFVLEGEKVFATLAPLADELLVVANRGIGEDGRNRLVVVRVARDASGVELSDGPQTPFAPEIPHARVRFTRVHVRADAVLPGDGYDAYVKPFRTTEDVFVLAATLGYVVSVGRAHDVERGLVLEALGLVHALVAIASAPVSDPRTHLALEGAFIAARRLCASLNDAWQTRDDDHGERARWTRDQPLLTIAGGARAKRAEAAWKSSTGSPGT